MGFKPPPTKRVASKTPRKKPAGSIHDPRRRYYRITAFGTAVARAETQRLAELVRLARHAWRTAESS